MIVGTITELEIFQVYDRGIVNKECIGIRVNETVNLGQFGVMVGVTGNVMGATPVRDFMFWFGDGVIQAGDFIFVYTGPGSAKWWRAEGKAYTVYSLHWGRNTTILANPQVVPFLFKVEAVQIPQPPRQLPELPRSSAPQVTQQRIGTIPPYFPPKLK